MVDLDEIKRIIGKRLRLLRVSTGQNQSEFALAVDTSQHQISTWEQGKSFISWAVLYRLEKLYGLDLGFLSPEGNYVFPTIEPKKFEEKVGKQHG